MKLVHKGLDGLDVAYKLALPEEVLDQLQDAKTIASQFKDSHRIEINTRQLDVANHGSSGGYTFVCDTGPLGVSLFVKQSTIRDPWGIRVSCKSALLATKGLLGAKQYIEKLLGDLGAAVAPNSESVSRVDVALDFLAPDFVLRPENFVMHSRCNRRDHIEFKVFSVNGRSGRTTSVTIGKNPGRQVIVYDKRSEVLDKRKVEWLEIWNQKLEQCGLPPIDIQNQNTSQIWRVEIRTYKKQLKSKWGVTTWNDLMPVLSEILTTTCEDIRYTLPNSDQNRARWKNDPIWDMVTAELEGTFDFDAPQLDQAPLLQAILEQKKHVLKQQILGCLISLGVLDNQTLASFGSYFAAYGTKLARWAHKHPEQLEEKMKNKR